MADSASFCTQANALLRKNLIFQKRNCRTNVRLILSPLILCLVLSFLQYLVNTALNKSSIHCGVGNSSVDQHDLRCSIPHPTEWPPLLQIPSPEYRAVRTDILSYGDLPSPSCKRTSSCPVAVLITGNNQTLGQSVAGNMFESPFSVNLSQSDPLYTLANNVLGSESAMQDSNFLDPAFNSDLPLHYVQFKCASDSDVLSISFQLGSVAVQRDLRCVQGLHMWRNSSSEINEEIYKGYHNGNPDRAINEILAAYDFLNTNMNIFNVNIWYNSTYKNDKGNEAFSLMRVPRSINLVSNAYLQHLLGPGTKMLFEFVKEMPKPETNIGLDISSALGPLFFTWVIIQLFPVVLSSLVYEKQHKLRIMMKMHGLGNGPYWMISYAYFLVISSVYMLCFVTFGSLIGLQIFTMNDYRIQFVFYFIYINLQVSLAFLVANMFSNVKTATVFGYILVFGSGLLGAYLFQIFLDDASSSRTGIIAMELYPGFSLYRGLYEFAQHSSTSGMKWNDLNDINSGMREVLIIISVEWLVVLVLAFYGDRVVSSGRSPLFFLGKKRQQNLSSSSRRPFVDSEKSDVVEEREKVEQLLDKSSTSHAIICYDIKKIYPGKDGNPEKVAVRGLSLALPKGECFGMLGPNGAGKTSFINMMIGLVNPSSGTAYVNGQDIRTDMDKIYTSMGVCPQHDLLWETLTGREHLLFYGRLKNLSGSALTEAVEESLKSVNLFHGGVADKQAGKYSGGMKRRLSVAISLIGDPKVVYMDEPSTGLDPASRNMLWKVVERAKLNRAIILTTHSMEEAEHLCDRLGIFVDGSLQCVGHPKELKARYGGSYVFTMTTSSNHEKEVENLVRWLSPNGKKIYQISGTQKFELPKQEIRIADVFQAVEDAKRRFTVQAWGIADTTLEDVFIKVAS